MGGTVGKKTKGSIKGSQRPLHTGLDATLLDAAVTKAGDVKQVAAEEVAEQATAAPVGAGVQEPELRGLNLGQLLQFFMLRCGHCCFQDADNGQRAVFCIPDRLTALIQAANEKQGSKTRKEDADEEPVEEGKRWVHQWPDCFAVEDLVVKPMTTKSCVSAAEMWNPGGLRARFFVSHTWGDDFAELVQALYSFSACTWPSRPDTELQHEVTFYIALLSTRQWRPPDSPGLWSLQTEPSCRVIASPSIEQVLVLMGPEAFFLQRAWCALELHLAVQLAKPVCFCTQHGPLGHIEAEHIPDVETWAVQHIDKVRHVDVATAAAMDEVQQTNLRGELSRVNGRGVSCGLSGAAAVNRELMVLCMDHLVPFLCRVGSDEAVSKVRDMVRISQVMELLAATGQQDIAAITIMLKPGTLGLQAEWPRGLIVEVAPGSLAEVSGIRSRWRFLRINGERPSPEVLRRCSRGCSAYPVVLLVEEERNASTQEAQTVATTQSERPSSLAPLLKQEWARCRSLWSLSGRLATDDPQVRRGALFDFKRLWADSRPLLEQAVSCLLDEDAMVQEAALEVLGHLHSAGIEPESLPAPSQRQRWRLELGQNLSCTDLCLRILAALLPAADATSLLIDFRCNSNFTDKGIVGLASALPVSLTELRLCLRNSTRATDLSLAALGEHWPPGLLQLELDFRNNLLMSTDGFEALLAKLPQQLLSLSLSFSGSRNFSDACLEVVARALPTSLQTLALCFHHHDNGSFTDAGLQVLAGALPPGLLELTVKFHGHRNFTDTGLGILSISLPPGLLELSLDFHSSRFTDAGLQQLALALPKKLRRLDLNFHCSGNLTDAGLQALVVMLPHGLLSLSLDFLCNINFSEGCIGALAAALPAGLQTFHFAHKMSVQESVAAIKRRYRLCA